MTGSLPLQPVISEPAPAAPAAAGAVIPAAGVTAGNGGMDADRVPSDEPEQPATPAASETVRNAERSANTEQGESSKPRQGMSRS